MCVCGRQDVCGNNNSSSTTTTWENGKREREGEKKSNTTHDVAMMTDTHPHTHTHTHPENTDQIFGSRGRTRKKIPIHYSYGDCGSKTSIFVVSVPAVYVVQLHTTVVELLPAADTTHAKWTSFVFCESVFLSLSYPLSFLPTPLFHMCQGVGDSVATLCEISQNVLNLEQLLRINFTTIHYG